MILALLLAAETVVHLTAKKFEFSPSTITLKRGVPVVLEITSLDRKHGFQVKDLGVDEEISPDKPTRIRIVPDRAGTFEFHCDVFCGSGHEDMAGQIVVTP
ncbi:MAG: cupredoxin domain-containing protein [Myxococcales bacterium]